jgi:hypothetical protein
MSSSRGLALGGNPRFQLPKFNFIIFSPKALRKIVFHVNMEPASLREMQTNPTAGQLQPSTTYFEGPEGPAYSLSGEPGSAPERVY